MSNRKKMPKKLGLDCSVKVMNQGTKETKYGMRAEYRRDCEMFRALFRPWLLSWKESAVDLNSDDSHVDEHGRIWASQCWGEETEVEFTLAEGGPNIEEIVWLMTSVKGCQFPVQTVMELEHYSGACTDRADYWPEAGYPPNNDVVKAARESLIQLYHFYESSQDEFKRTLMGLTEWVYKDEAFNMYREEKRKDKELFLSRLKLSELRELQADVAKMIVDEESGRRLSSEAKLTASLKKSADYAESYGVSLTEFLDSTNRQWRQQVVDNYDCLSTMNRSAD